MHCAGAKCGPTDAAGPSLPGPTVLGPGQRLGGGGRGMCVRPIAGNPALCPKVAERIAQEATAAGRKTGNRSLHFVHHSGSSTAGSRPLSNSQGGQSQHVQAAPPVWQLDEEDGVGEGLRSHCAGHLRGTRLWHRHPAEQLLLELATNKQRNQY